MKRLLLKFAITAVVVVPLVACGKSNKRDEVVVAPPTSAPAPPPVGTASLESLGASFAALFRASNNTEPRDPTEGDLPPVSFTTEPVDITGV